MSENLNLPAIPENMQLVAFSDEQLAKVSTNSDWLPRLQVMGSNSELVKSQKMPLGVFGLVNGDNAKNLGNELDVLVVSVRPMALRIANGTPLSYFNVDSDAFQAVQRESDIQDSGCMCGPQFLVWIPSEKTFATFYCSGKSARREAPNVLAVMTREDGTKKPGMATLKIHFVPKSEKNKYSWHTFLASQCSTPPSSLPESENFLDELKKFNNPVDSKIEAAQPQQNQRAR